MADILIRGMEMPKTCQICRTAKFDRIVGCEEWDRLSIAQRMYMRSETCPLIPLPEGHGRCIDVDALEDMDFESCDTSDCYEIKWRIAGMNHIRQIVKDALTIVPAEGGEH